LIIVAGGCAVAGELIPFSVLDPPPPSTLAAASPANKVFGLAIWTPYQKRFPFESYAAESLRIRSAWLIIEVGSLIDAS
jgi:hypothetical protein